MRDVERNFHCLLIVQARIELCLVGCVEVTFGQAARASDTFGDILAGSSRWTPPSREPYCRWMANDMQVREARDQSGGFASVSGGERVAMHWVANPKDLVSFGSNRFDQARKLLFDLVLSQAMNESQSARFVFRFSKAISSSNSSTCMEGPT